MVSEVVGYCGLKYMKLKHIKMKFEIINPTKIELIVFLLRQ